MSESLAWIRDTYSVPANIDQRIRFTGYAAPLEGRIIGAQAGHLHVLFDTEPGVVAMHPTWEVEYLSAVDELLGIAPDWTGGQSVDEYMDEERR